MWGFGFLVRVAGGAAAFIFLALGVARAGDFVLDTDHTQAEFTVTHLAISHVRGQVPLASGTIAIGANDLPTAVSATLDVKSIETQDADRDRDLRGADWFDVDKYPTMTFVAKKISGTPAAFTIDGDLTFHGVTKPVVLTAKEEGKIVDGRGRTHVGFSAATTIDRRDWGLDWGKTTPGGALVVANDVTIDLNVEAVSK
jgi:polyisoprenoid-binding protein YceI